MGDEKGRSDRENVRESLESGMRGKARTNSKHRAAQVNELVKVENFRVETKSTWTRSEEAKVIVRCETGWPVNWEPGCFEDMHDPRGNPRLINGQLFSFV